MDEWLEKAELFTTSKARAVSIPVLGGCVAFAEDERLQVPVQVHPEHHIRLPVAVPCSSRVLDLSALQCGVRCRL